jgi:DNA mismatch endonuclease (patch repair protein)
MRDFFSPEERSKLMSRIRGRANVSTELKIAGFLRAAGVHGWRRHLSLPGRPDFTFPKQRVCIFVHGCFWHDCPRCRKRSSTRPEYWAGKIEVNRRRDLRVSRELRRRGYKVIVVWLATTHRGFAFYVAFPKSSIRPGGLPIYVARVPSALFASRSSKR